MNDRVSTVIGVLPATAEFGVLQILRSADYNRGFAERGLRASVDVFAPLQGDANRLPRDTHPIFLLGRLAPGAGVPSAQQELGAIAADLERAYPVNADRGVFIQSVRDVVLGPVRPSLLLLLSGVALVLLIACVNVAHLLLARGTVRIREIAIKRALGAGAGRLARQFAAESVVLMLMSSALGVLLAVVALRVLLASAPSDIPRLAAVTIDGHVLGVILVITAGIAAIFGLVPLIQTRRSDLQGTLKVDEARGATGGRERGLARSALVVAEIALAVVLVIAAGLLIKSFWRLRQVDPGFVAEGVVKAEFQLPATRYSTGQASNRFNSTLLARVAAFPQVDSAAIAAEHPLAAGFTNSFAVVGREAEARDWPEISVRRVTPGYFRTLRIPLARGRMLSESDDVSAPPVLLINREAARRFFRDQDPVGHQIRLWGAARTIVGVLGDERIHGVTQPAPIALYLPFAQVPSAGGVLMVRTAGDPGSIMAPIRAAVRAIDPALAVSGVESLDQTLWRSVGEQRFTMLLTGLFGVVALALAIIGIHGVLSYTVTRRTREIGIRIALGAAPGRVTGLVLRQSAGLTVAGLAIGVMLAVVFARSLTGLLFGVTSTDPATFASVAILLGAVAMLAAWLPARRASRLDPLVALRYE